MPKIQPLRVERGRMMFTRLAIGLNPIVQEGNRRAPAKKGYWAFPYPYFEPYLAYHKYFDALPVRLQTYDEDTREQRDEWLKKVAPRIVKKHNFWHPGPIFSVFDSRARITHDFMSGKGPWCLLDIDTFAKAAYRHLAQMATSSRGMNFDLDYMEVFIPCP